jgi:Na+/proline symporter
MEKVFFILIFSVAVLVEETPQAFRIPSELIDYDYIEGNDSSTTFTVTEAINTTLASPVANRIITSTIASKADAPKLVWKSQWGTLEITGVAAIVVVCILVLAGVIWNFDFLENACLTRCACSVCVNMKSRSFTPEEQNVEKMYVFKNKNFISFQPT